MIGNKIHFKSKDSSSFSVDNVTELKALKLENNSEKIIVQTSGYHTTNDGGGAKYFYDKTSVLTDDDFTVILPNNGIGRFILLIDKTINIRTAGVFGNGVTDDTLKIQKAIDYVSTNGGGVVEFIKGTYLITDTIILKQYVKLTSAEKKQVYLPTVRPEIKANFTSAKTMIDLGDGNTNRRGMGVYGLCLNGNFTAEVGIKFSDTIQNEIKENLFINIKTDGVALYGGGALYLYIENNSFSTGDFYALDSQKNYAYNTVGHYYGINVGTFSKNVVGCSYGIRHEGILDIEENDFEFAVKKRAAIDINSATANSYTNIRNNYFEIFQSFTPLTAIRLSSNVGEVSGNRIYGQTGLANSIAIDLGVPNFSISVNSNTITRWGIGIRSYSSNVGHGDGILNYDISTNFFNFVTTRISNAANTNSITTSLNNGDYRHSAQSINFGNYQAFQNAISLGSCSLKYGVATGLNLVKGNIFKITDTAPVTISNVTNKVKGFVFTIYATSNNVVTLPNSVFNLSCGRDLLLPANTVLLFEVDYDGNIKEVGFASSLIYQSTAPVDAVKPVGYINIQGKKIPYFN